MSSGKYVVIGAGGHAKVVVATIEAAAGRVVAVLDDDDSRKGHMVSGHTVSGPVAQRNIPPDALVVLAVGSNRVREKLSARLSCRFGTVVHPSAVVHDSVTIGEGSVVMAGCVIQPGTRIGRHCIVNTAASIDHDCIIEDFCHIAPGVHLAGAVTVAAGAFMGIASCAVPGVRVGAWAVVGAGGVVTNDIAPDMVAVGVPARELERRRS